jgi:hypothetical protein
MDKILTAYDITANSPKPFIIHCSSFIVHLYFKRLSPATLVAGESRLKMNYSLKTSLPVCCWPCWLVQT